MIFCSDSINQQQCRIIEDHNWNAIDLLCASPTEKTLKQMMTAESAALIVADAVIVVLEDAKKKNLSMHH